MAEISISMILPMLQKALKTKYEAEFRDGIHVSDLTLCIRKSIFRKLDPTPITMKELSFFTSGRAMHEALQALTSAYPSTFEMEKSINYDKIVGHIDVYNKIKNIPIEFKTYRAKSIEQPKGFHLAQLKAYMAMINATKGEIIYQCLMNFDGNPFVSFDIQTTEEENKTTLQVLLLKAEDYTKNLEAKTPLKAESVFNNKEMNWLCKDCPYYQQCEDCPWDGHTIFPKEKN